MEGTMPIMLMIMEGTPPLRGVPYPTSDLQLWRAPGRFAASPTQPYKCSQNVKVKINALLTLTLILTY